MFMHDQKHSNLTSTYTKKRLCLFSLPTEHETEYGVNLTFYYSCGKMYTVLGLLFKHRSLEKQGMLLRRTLDILNTGVSQFSCLFNFVSHNCTQIIPEATCCVLLTVKCISCCKRASVKTCYTTSDFRLITSGRFYTVYCNVILQNGLWIYANKSCKPFSSQ